MGHNIEDLDPDTITNVPFSPIAPTASSSVTAAPSPSVSNVSTISQSSSSAKSVNYDIATPQLIEPSESLVLQDFERLLKLQEQEIIKKLLDTWSESIKERGRLILEELRSEKYKNWLHINSPQFLSERNSIRDEIAMHQSPAYLAWLASLSPVDQSAQLNFQAIAITQAASIDAVGSYADRTVRGQISAVDAIPTVAASIAIGITNLGEIVTTKEIGKVADMNASIFDQIWKEITPTITPEIRPDILGLIGAMMMVRLTALTTVEMVEGNAGAKQAALPTKKFSEEYAKLVIQLVKGKDLDKQSSDMLGDDKSKPTGEGSAILKIVFLSTALALLYKQEAGKITGEEFDAMITGEIPLKKEDTKATLVGLMRNSLSELSPENRENILDSLFNYMNTNPKVEQKMVEASKLYTNLMHTLPSQNPIVG